jgi:hypothetical protein
MVSFSLAVLLVLGLAGLIQALPAQLKSEGIKISLTRRSHGELTDADGVCNITALMSTALRSVQKHARGIHNFKFNTRAKMDIDWMDIDLPVVDELLKRQRQELMPYNNNALWAVRSVHDIFML